MPFISFGYLARWSNNGSLDEMEVIQLSIDYNAKHRERRDEVCGDHPPGTVYITELVPGCFRVMWGSVQAEPMVRTHHLGPDDRFVIFASDGLWDEITNEEAAALVRNNPRGVTRAIGHVYLKYDLFNQEPLPPEYINEEPIIQPIVKAEPTVRTHQLGPDDRFIIFASDGLWDVMNNKQATDLVKNNPRNGVAAKLMREALKIAASKYQIEDYPVDISIVIVFFDNFHAPEPPAECPFQEYNVTLF